MVFGNTYRRDIHFVAEFMEGLGQLLTMAAFLVFGAFLLPDGLAHAGAKYDHSCVGLPHAGPCLANLRFSDKGAGYPRVKLFLGWFWSTRSGLDPVHIADDGSIRFPE